MRKLFKTLAIATSLVLLSGCDGVRVYLSDTQQAMKTCENLQGVSIITVAGRYIKITCNDGAYYIKERDLSVEYIKIIEKD